MSTEQLKAELEKIKEVINVAVKDFAEKAQAYAEETCPFSIGDVIREKNNHSNAKMVEEIYYSERMTLDRAENWRLIGQTILPSGKLSKKECCMWEAEARPDEWEICPKQNDIFNKKNKP